MVLLVTDLHILLLSCNSEDDDMFDVLLQLMRTVKLIEKPFKVEIMKCD